MVELTIELSNIGIFKQDKTTYKCICGHITAFIGNLHPIRCFKCNLLLPDLQLLKRSARLRAVYHCNKTVYEDNKWDYIDDAFY